MEGLDTDAYNNHPYWLLLLFIHVISLIKCIIGDRRHLARYGTHRRRVRSTAVPTQEREEIDIRNVSRDNSMSIHGIHSLTTFTDSRNNATKSREAFKAKFDKLGVEVHVVNDRIDTSSYR